MQSELEPQKSYRWVQSAPVIIRDDVKRIEFGLHDKFMFNLNGKLRPFIRGLFDPRPSGWVTYIGYADGVYYFECNDLAAFKDVSYSDRRIVKEVMQQMGLQPSEQDADTMLECLGLLPDECNRGLSPSWYYERIIERASRYTCVRGSSWVGDVWDRKQRMLFNLLFGFEVSRFLCIASQANRFRMDICRMRIGGHRCIGVTVDGKFVSDFLEDFGIKQKELVFSDCPKDDSWWDLPYVTSYDDCNRKVV